MYFDPMMFGDMGCNPDIEVDHKDYFGEGVLFKEVNKKLLEAYAKINLVSWAKSAGGLSEGAFTTIYYIVFGYANGRLDVCYLEDFCR